MMDIMSTPTAVGADIVTAVNSISHHLGIRAGADGFEYPDQRRGFLWRNAALQDSNDDEMAEFGNRETH